MSSCIVVGGGLIGMLSARQLAKTGVRVTLLERNPNTGLESSWAGGGILSPLYAWRYPEAVNALALWGQQRYEIFSYELLDETGIDPEYFGCGMLVTDADQWEKGASWADAHRVSYQMLDHSAHGPGLYFPNIANIRNPRYAQALRASLDLNQVRVVENCAVTGLQVQDGSVTGVETDKGDYRASTVVIAGGAWSGSLLDRYGVITNIKPIKGQMILYRAEPGLLKHIVLHEGRYLIPRKDGHILAGSTMEDVGFDKSTSEPVFQELSSFAKKVLPELSNFPLVQHWAGLRPGSPDGVPIIAQHPEIEGLYINAGHFRNGVVLALASAHMLKGLVLGENLPFPCETYGFIDKN